MNRPSNCLIIFTRYPEPGKTKTRLIPALGATGAAKLQRAMSESAISEAQQLQAIGFLDIQIYYAGGNLELMSDWLGNKLIYKPQAVGDLGVKMSVALATAFDEGYKSAVIIGTDCPSLDKTILERAFSLLPAKDLVLGTAADGGYYLIGSNIAIPQLFDSIKWSTSEVCDRTIETATQLGLDIGYLPTLFDIDRPEDLELIKDTPNYQNIIASSTLTE